MPGLYILRWSDANQFHGEIVGNAWSVCQAYRSLKLLFSNVPTEGPVGFAVFRGIHQHSIEEVEFIASSHGIDDEWINSIAERNAVSAC